MEVVEDHEAAEVGGTGIRQIFSNSFSSLDPFTLSYLFHQADISFLYFYPFFQGDLYQALLGSGLDRALCWASARRAAGLPAGLPDAAAAGPLLGHYVGRSNQ